MRGTRQIDDKTGKPKDFEINALPGVAQKLNAPIKHPQQRRGLWTHSHGKARCLNHFSMAMQHQRGACGQLAR